MQRLTKQRKIILEELKKVHSHPTAEEIFEIVRSKMPNISLATVYRNLDVLEKNGQVLKLQARKGDKARYDGNCCSHCHLVCKKCGVVLDVFDVELEFSSHETDANGFKITADHLEIPGLCQECQKRSK